jgi:hypothetical protein
LEAAIQRKEKAYAAREDGNYNNTTKAQIQSAERAFEKAARAYRSASAAWNRAYHAEKAAGDALIALGPDL